MNYFDKQFNDVELKSRALAEQKAKIIYDTLEQRYNVSRILVTPPESDYIGRVQTMLLDPYLNAIHPKCLELLKQNGADMRSFLFSFINVLLLPNIPYEVSMAAIKVLKSLNIYESFDMNGSNIDITTTDGSMHLDRVDEWLRDTHRLAVDRQGFPGNCHSVTQSLAGYFPDYYATTVTMPAYFGGNFYHSFFTSADNELIVDFSIGDVVKKGDFYNIIGCNEILNIPTRDISDAYNTLVNNDDVPKDMCPLLALAIDNQRRR